MVEIVPASSKPESGTQAKTSRRLDDANKTCRHTLLSVSALSNELFDVYCLYKETKAIWDLLILKYTTENVVPQIFILGNYYILILFNIFFI